MAQPVDDVNPTECYEQNLTRYKDERDEIQKKTFTKWVNKHLVKHWKHDEARKKISDLYEDLRDGHNLISLLEVLSQEIIPRERGRLRFHRLQNVQNALDFLRYKKIKLVNIRNDDIVDGNPKLTLGLIWTIILHFQISDIIVTGQPSDKNVKEALLLWSRRTTDGYPGVNIKDFSNSWSDGLAFNAIIHRNRPDLIDFKALSRDNPRANLENAFDVAEEQFGVTKLLDPEDVDRSNPDEKSIITYVSSLYDVFPEVPTIQDSLADNERALRWEEYQDAAQRLMQWITHSTTVMEDRHFPNNLQDLRVLLQQFNTYRLETVPPKISDKHKLTNLFRDLEKLFAPTGQFNAPQGLHIQDIDAAWDRLMLAQQDRDKVLRSEIARLERLYLLAEKVHRHTRSNGEALEGLERRIEADEPRIDKMDPHSAKKRADQIDAGLKMCETGIREMFNDTQVLKDGNYYEADQIYRRVLSLHEKWLALRNRLQSNIASKVVLTEETMTRRYETRTEFQVVETNEIFKFIQECLIWVQNKQAAIDSLDYGNDLPSVQSYLRQHGEEHQTIIEFKVNIDRCRAAKSNLSGDEFTLYSQHLGRLEQTYASVLDSSAKRYRDLELLLEFMQASTTELMWLNEKEENEISRDWSAKNLHIPELETHYQSLLSELQTREPQFNAVLSKGQQLMMESHPSSKIVEAYLQAMQSQWAWLIQLTICLEQHLIHAATYHQFYGDARDCEQWLNDQAEILNRKYDRTDLTLEQSMDLLQELFEMKEKVNEYKDTVNDLVVRSKQVVPLKQRRQYLKTKLPITALCDYIQMDVSIKRGEECVLVDNTEKTKWKIITSLGQEASVPGACFLIPPPNKEAIEYAARLEIQYQHLLTLWRTKHMKLKQIVAKNEIFISINKVKQMSLEQFEDMDPIQREAILRQLNEDAQRLRAESHELEGTVIDPELEALEREVDNCNQLIQEMSKTTTSPLDDQQAAKVIADIDTFSRDIDTKISTLFVRLKQPIPREPAAILAMAEEHQNFHQELVEQQPHYHTLRINCESIIRQAEPEDKPKYKSTLSVFIEKWEYIWTISVTHVQTLTISVMILKSLEKAKDVVTKCELALLAQDSVPCDLSQAQLQQEKLQDLKRSLTPFQPVIDELNEEVKKLKSFPNPTADVEDVVRFERDVRDVEVRWMKICIQTDERLKKLEVVFDLLREFKDALLDEKNWLAQAQATMMILDYPATDRRSQEKQFEETKAFLDEIRSHRPNVEEFNSRGNQFIQAAEALDEFLEEYKDSLEDIPEIEDIKKAKLQSGVDLARQEIESVNEEYSKLGADIADRLRTLASKLGIPEGELLERFTMFVPIGLSVQPDSTPGVRSDVSTTVETTTRTVQKTVFSPTELDFGLSRPEQAEKEVTSPQFTATAFRPFEPKTTEEMGVYSETMQIVTAPQPQKPEPSTEVPRKRTSPTKPEQPMEKPTVTRTQRVEIKTTAVKTPPSSPPKSPDKKKHVPPEPAKKPKPSRTAKGPVEVSISSSRREEPKLKVKEPREVTHVEVPQVVEEVYKTRTTVETEFTPSTLEGKPIGIELVPEQIDKPELVHEPESPAEGRPLERPFEVKSLETTVEKHKPFVPTSFEGPREIVVKMRPGGVQQVTVEGEDSVTTYLEPQESGFPPGEETQHTGYIPQRYPSEEGGQPSPDRPVEVEQTSQPYGVSRVEPVSVKREEEVQQWTDESPDGTTTTTTTRRVVQISSTTVVSGTEVISTTHGGKPDSEKPKPIQTTVVGKAVSKATPKFRTSESPEKTTAPESPKQTKRTKAPEKIKKPESPKTSKVTKVMKKPESPTKLKKDPESPRSKSVKPESPKKKKVPTATLR